MDEDTYRRRLRERRIREIKRNRTIFAAVVAAVIIIACVILVFKLGRKLGVNNDNSSVVALSGSGLADESGENIANFPLDTRSESEGSGAASDESDASLLASESRSSSGADKKGGATETGTSKDDSEAGDNPPVSSKKANAYLKYAVFIGDSRTQGLQINSGVTTASFLAGRGLNVTTIYEEKVISNKYTVLEALRKKQYKKVYICFGLNELGWAYPDKFIEKYGNLIDDIEKIEPDAEIIVESIAPVTKKKSKSDKTFNMKRIHKFNKLIKAMCKEKKLTYLDVTPAVVGDDGYLPAEATSDGIHMNKEYCKKIISYIVNNKY